MLHLSRSLNTSFSRCVMAGLVCGILAGVLNAGYTYLYGKVTGFTISVFDALLIFFGVPLLFIIAGFILYEMVEYIKRGRLWFTILSLLLVITAIILALASSGKAMDGHLPGVILITGLLIAFLLPYLATHARIFMDDKEFSESADS